MLKVTLLKTGSCGCQVPQNVAAYVRQGAGVEGVEGVRNVISTLVLVSTLTLFRATLLITTVELKVTEGLFNRSHNKGLSDTLLT